MSAKDGRRVKTRGFTRTNKRRNTKYVSGKSLAHFAGRNTYAKRKVS
jgi:hypothetical protein